MKLTHTSGDGLSWGAARKETCLPDPDLKAAFEKDIRLLVHAGVIVALT